MAQITIDIPDNVVSDVLDAFADKYGWTSEMGISKANFGRKKVADYIKATYIEYKDKQSHTVRLSQAEAERLAEIALLEQTVIS
jgi:hypothetical protein